VDAVGWRETWILVFPVAKRARRDAKVVRDYTIRNEGIVVDHHSAPSCRVFPQIAKVRGSGRYILVLWTGRKCSKACKQL
jgi:hypothetical protein